jgi:SAM-dependent methyltransferase
MPGSAASRTCRFPPMHLDALPSDDVPEERAPSELDRALASWADRVQADRAQVDRFREVPDGADFYGPVTARFRADPRRTDDPQLDSLLALARRDETWLDIGAGAGRFALPLARHVRRVIALDPSAGMLAALREAAAEHGIGNIDVRPGRWPAAWAERDEAADGQLAVDVALMAHVGYDIELIGPFLDAMEACAGRLCVALLMERQPSASMDAFWPAVHGEARVELPGWPQLVEVLRLRGRVPEIEEVTRARRVFGSVDEVADAARRQLWLEPGSEKDQRLRALAAERAIRGPDGWYIEADDPRVAVVTWVPRHRPGPSGPRGAEAEA